MAYKLIDYEGLRAFSDSLKSKYATKNDIPKKLSDFQDDATHRLVTDEDKAKINNSIKEITLFRNSTDETYISYRTQDNNREFILIPYAHMGGAGLMSRIDKRKLNGIVEGANKVTKLSELENDTTFKTELEIQQMISNASSLKKEVATSLPATGKDDVIYLVQDPKGKDNNNYLEYLWLNGKYELIGSTQVDLSGYAKLEDIVASKVVDIYTLEKDFYTALSSDINFQETIGRDMLTLVMFGGDKAIELATQAGFASILYYKGRALGVDLMPMDGQIDADFVKQNKFTQGETYITSRLMKNYNEAIQGQLKEQKDSSLNKADDKAIAPQGDDLSALGWKSDDKYATPLFVSTYTNKWVEALLNMMQGEVDKKLNKSDIQEFTQQELEEAFK